MQNSSPSLVIQIKWKQKAQNISAQRTKFPFSLSLWPLRCVKKKNPSISLSSTDWYSALFFLAPRDQRSLLVHSFESVESSENTHTHTVCRCIGKMRPPTRLLRASALDSDHQFRRSTPRRVAFLCKHFTFCTTCDLSAQPIYPAERRKSSSKFFVRQQNVFWINTSFIYTKRTNQIYFCTPIIFNGEY